MSRIYTLLNRNINFKGLAYVIAEASMSKIRRASQHTGNLRKN